MTSLKKLAEDAKKLNKLSPDEMFQRLLTDIAKTESYLQAMIDSIVAIQGEWPMPEDGWRQFVEDMERTNERYDFNLQIKN